MVTFPTEQPLNVLHHLARGYTYKRIGARLDISLIGQDDPDAA